MKLVLLAVSLAAAEDFDIGVILRRLRPPQADAPAVSVILPRLTGEGSQHRGLKWEGKTIELVLDPTLYEPHGILATYQRGNRGYELPPDRMRYFPQTRTLVIDADGLLNLGERFSLHFDDSQRRDELNSRFGFLRSLRARGFASLAQPDATAAYHCRIVPYENGRRLEVTGLYPSSGSGYFYEPEEDLDVMLAWLHSLRGCADRPFPPPVRHRDDDYPFERPPRP